MLHELCRAGYEPDWRRVETRPDYLACLEPTLDIILADYSLPQFDALRALHLLQERDLDIPFIVVTGSVSEEAAVECMRQGATDYLLKDRLGRLGPAVERALQQKHLRDEKRQAEDALRESEEKHRGLFESSPESIALISLDGTILDFNEATTILGGLPRDNMIGRSFTEIGMLDAENLPRMVEHFSQLADGQVVKPLQVKIIRGGNETRWVEVFPALLKKDSSAYAIQIISRDITERRRAEEEIKKLNQDLERRARELAALNAAGRALSSMLDLDKLLELIIGQVKSLLDAEAASVLLHTPAKADAGDQPGAFSAELVFAASAGPGSEQLVGTRLPATAGIAGWVVREKQPALVADVQNDPRFYNRIDAATGITTRSLLAVPLVFQDKTLGVVEAVNKIPVSGHSTFDEHNLATLQALASSAAIAIENARLYRAEWEAFRRLQDSQAQLIQSEKMAALGRLVASIAHEINNPLQAIQNSIELAEEELESGLRREKLTRYLGMALSEIQRLAAIVRRVRDFYRPVRQEMQPTDVHAILRDVLELTGKQLQHSQIAVEQEEAYGFPLIQANPDHLKQAFLNLVLNAIDAMSMQGGVLSVRTAPDHIPGSDNRPLPAVRIEFADTGDGIPAEILPHIFEPFMTTKKAGTGLAIHHTWTDRGAQRANHRGKSDGAGNDLYGLATGW